MKKLIIIISIILLGILVAGVVILLHSKKEIVQDKSLSLSKTNTMTITSSTFQENAQIPKKYTCDGENINPALTLSDIPQNAKSLVLIVDDPDAPAGIWTHWLLWNISSSTAQIEEGKVPHEAVQGKTSFGDNKYGGPCPSPGKPHHYRFKIFALSDNLNLSPQSKQEDLEEAMKRKIIAQATLVGTYQR